MSKFHPTLKIIDSNTRRANDHLIESPLKERSNSQFWPSLEDFTNNSNWVIIGFKTKAGNIWSGNFVASTPWQIVVNFDSRSNLYRRDSTSNQLRFKSRVHWRVFNLHSSFFGLGPQCKPALSSRGHQELNWMKCLNYTTGGCCWNSMSMNEAAMAWRIDHLHIRKTKVKCWFHDGFRLGLRVQYDFAHPVKHELWALNLDINYHDHPWGYLSARNSQI